jgi:DNA modification methylase
MNDPRTMTLSYDGLTGLSARKRPDNPKTHDGNAIGASVSRAGFVTPPVVNDADGLLLEGHGRVDVLVALRQSGVEPPDGIHVGPDGDWLVPTVHGARLSPLDAQAFVVAANRTVELGGWDEKRLAQVLLDLAESEAGLSGVGYDAQDLDRLVSSLLSDVDRQSIHPDDVPAVDDRDVSVRAGDVYSLGPHTLICGDSRVPAHFTGVLEGRSAAALITDPPYGVGYKGKGERKLTIAGDDERGLDDLLTASFASVDAVLAPGAGIYIFHPAGPLSLLFGQAVCAQGWSYRQSLVWNKGAAVLGHSHYQYAHEPVIYAVKASPAGRGRGRWFGGRDQSSVLEYPRPGSSREHPTIKPVGILEAFLKNSTERGDVVIDPFLGWGSLLIAADRLGRRCVGVEIEPRYAQVAIRRWERFAGQSARLVKEG